MMFEQLNDGACRTYLVADEDSGNAILVDPVLEETERYLAEIRRRGLDLAYVLDTHVHADHISGAAAIKDRAGAAYVMHRDAPSACADTRVDEGDVLYVGKVRMRFLHVPGHTQDSLLVVLPDRILTGDFLFIGEGGAGRTDLPGGDPGDHWDSLRKLAELPGHLRVFPAHDYRGNESSTLAEERRTNPRLQPRTREEYVAWLQGLRLGPADWMAEVIRQNYACALDPAAAWIPADAPSCEVGGTAGNVNAELVQEIRPEELVENLADTLVLDVREPHEFHGALGRVPGSRNVPLGLLPHRLDELQEWRTRPIVAVCRSGGRSATAAAILTVAGFTDAYNLAGGMLRWNEQALPLESAA